MPESVSPEALRAELAAGVARHVIDVRTPAEHAAVHVRGARLHPLGGLDAQAVAAERGDADGPTLVLCKSGGRAATAAARLRDAGVPCAVVAGGTDACVAAGVPVVRGEAAGVSLERQVRIAAGALVLVGLALGWWVSPWLLGIAGFVGAGLVFSGVSNTCGMGLVLLKMPWNR